MSVVVLNSAEAMHELLDRRGANFCERPTRPLVEVSGASRGMSMAPYTPRLQHLRRMVKEVGGSAGVDKYADIVETERHRFLRRVLDDQSDLVKHLQRHNTPASQPLTHSLPTTNRSSASAIVDVNYGYDICDDSDAIYIMLKKGMKAITELLMKRGTIADVLPIRTSSIDTSNLSGSYGPFSSFLSSLIPWRSSFPGCKGSSRLRYGSQRETVSGCQGAAGMLLALVWPFCILN
jgi:hypothetical protein